MPPWANLCRPWTFFPEGSSRLCRDTPQIKIDSYCNCYFPMSPSVRICPSSVGWLVGPKTTSKQLLVEHLFYSRNPWSERERVVGECRRLLPGNNVRLLLPRDMISMY